MLQAACTPNPPSITQETSAGSVIFDRSGNDSSGIGNALIGVQDHLSFLPPILERIAPENADRMELLAQYGRGAVYDLGWSPDGEKLAMAAALGVYLYDSGSQEIIWFRETDSAQIGLDYALDGNKIVTGGENGVVSVWNVADGVRSLRIAGHSKRVTQVQFSPDSSKVVSLEDGEAIVEVWDAQTGQNLRSLQGGELRSGEVAWTFVGGQRYEWAVGGFIFIRDIDVSPNGLWVAAVTDRSLRIWDIESGALRVVVAMPTEAMSIEYSPTGDRLATVHHGDYVWLRDGGTGQPLRSIVPENRSVQAAVFSSDGALLSTWGWGSGLQLWDLENRGDPINMGIGVGPAAQWWRTAARPKFVGDGDGWKFALPVGGTAALWRSGETQPYATFVLHQDAIQDLQIIDGGNAILAVASSATIWDNHTGQLRHVFDLSSSPLPGAGSANGKMLARLLNSGQIEIWDTERLELIASIPSPAPGPSRLTFDPSEQILSVLHSNNRIRLWDLNSQTLLHELFGPERLVRSMFFSADGSVFGASGSAVTFPNPQYSTLLWDVGTGQLLNTVDEPGAWGASTSVDPQTGRIVQTRVEWSQDMMLSGTRILEGANWRTLYTLEGINPSHQPGGAIIATSDIGGAIWLWDFASGDLLRKIPADEPGVNPRMALTTDELVLASVGGVTPELKLWSTDTGRLLANINKLGSGVTALVFSADGKLLVTGSENGVVSLWGVVPWSESN